MKSDKQPNEALISIIVPVYKVEPYLDRCVQSIVNQTYRNLEIILVDDGSPDRCPEMCDAWAKEDQRVRVIHQKNGGLSDARNAGMAAAKGEYMGFVDSDDWIEHNMYELLFEHLQKENADIAACGVEMNWEDDTPSRMLTGTGSCVLSQTEAMRAIIEESWLKQPVWYKLYKSELIWDIRFPVGKYHEDVFWSYQALAKAQKTVVFDTPCYHYLQRGGSIMGNGYSLKRLDAVEAGRERCKFIEQYFPELAGTAQGQFIGNCIYQSQKLDAGMDPKAAYRKNLHQIAVSVGDEWKNEKTISKKQKVWIRLYMLFPKAVCKIRNGLGIGV